MRHIQRVFWSFGSLGMASSQGLGSMGPEVFHEDLFAYCETIDLAWRLCHAGWNHSYNPRAIPSFYQPAR